VSKKSKVRGGPVAPVPDDARSAAAYAAYLATGSPNDYVRYAIARAALKGA
jgi:hypothetical protein